MMVENGRLYVTAGGTGRNQKLFAGNLATQMHQMVR